MGKLEELELSVEPQVVLYTTLTLLAIMTSLSTMFQLGKNAVLFYTLFKDDSKNGYESGKQNFYLKFHH